MEDNISSSLSLSLQLYLSNKILIKINSMVFIGMDILETFNMQPKIDITMLFIIKTYLVKIYKDRHFKILVK